MRIGPFTIERRVALRAQDNAYGVNLPGRGYADPSKPLTQADLRQTFGAVGTQIIAGIIPQFGEPPDLQGDRFFDTVERMWKSDGQCAALMNVYLLPLLQATYSIQAASDDAEDVTIAQETSDNLMHGMVGMTWHRFLRQLYLFRGLYGHYVGEKCWTIDDTGAIRLKKLAPRLPRTLYRWFPNVDDDLDRIMQRVWVQDENGVTGKYEFPIIPAQKLLVSTRNQIGNDYRGVSLFRPCYKHHYYKDQLYAIDGIAAAKNAMGVPVFTEPAQVDSTRQASDRTLAANALAAYQVNERSYFLVPGGWTFDLKAVSGQVRNIMPSIEHHDLLMSRSFLAQFINLDSGGTLIAARDSSAFFEEALQSEAEEVADDVNPVIREMEEYNHARDRYSTLQMQGLDQRDLDQYLKGIAALITAKGITPDPGFEDWLRDYIDAPARPESRGAGVGGVDSDSQGEASGEGAADAAERTGAAGTDIGATDEATDLARELREFRIRDAARGATAQRVVAQAARQHLKRQPSQGLVTVPRANGETLELRRFGNRWETYSRERSVWSGFGPGTLRASRAGGSPAPPADEELGIGDAIRKVRSLLPGGKRPNGGGVIPRGPMKPKTPVMYDWVLGDGGKSGEHCPECEDNAANGPYTADTLPGRPRDGSTVCEDSCTCRLRVRPKGQG